MEAVGKNLFAFFADDATTLKGREDDEEDVVVVHVHFGMSGAWALYDDISADEEPAAKPTTRLRLEEITGTTANNRKRGSAAASKTKYITHLSAMTVAHGDLSLYSDKKTALGQDPLRSDADPEFLFSKITKSKKSIGQLLMDQSYFAGPGNIYRAEILFLAGVYPTIPGINLQRTSFDKIWNVSVSLLRRGYDSGSILTVDPRVDPSVASRGERRYIYNRSVCARCDGRVSSWDMAGRTCYACEGGRCQPKIKTESRNDEDNRKTTIKEAQQRDASVTAPKGKKKRKEKQARQHVPFISHCARISFRQRLEQGGAGQLTIVEIRSVIEQLLASDNNVSVKDGATLPPKSARKSVHVEALNNLLRERTLVQQMDKEAATVTSSPLPPPTTSAAEAAREKAANGENRAVEHMAELSREQAVRAISVTPSPAAEKRGRRKRSSGKSIDVPKSERDGNERTTKQRLKL